MSRSERLLQLLQLLRRHRYPISGQALADELGISVRTLYRDIATLQGQGAQIEGEPGMGYILRPGFMLPPLMFQHEELEALVLGIRWVAKKGDKELKRAAENALSKISDVLPAELQHQLSISGLLVGPSQAIEIDEDILVMIRKSMRLERKLQMRYQSLKEEDTSRVIWPIAMGFYDQVRTLIGWCELRSDFRHFRVDRITELTMLEQRYPKQRAMLLREWQRTFDIPPQ